MPSIETANKAPRCQHIALDNKPCTQPALRGRDFCRFHVSASDIRAAFPVIEDGLSLQAALMQVTRGILDGSLDRKTASLVLYSFQIMCASLKRMNEERALAQKLVKKDDDDIPGPSLAEILLDRLQIMEEGNAAERSATQNPVILNDAAATSAPAFGAHAASESKDPLFSDTPRPSASPAVKPDSPSGTIDKLEACADPAFEVVPKGRFAGSPARSAGMRNAGNVESRRDEPTPRAVPTGLGELKENVFPGLTSWATSESSLRDFATHWQTGD